MLDEVKEGLVLLNSLLALQLIDNFTIEWFWREQVWVVKLDKHRVEGKDLQAALETIRDIVREHNALYPAEALRPECTEEERMDKREALAEYAHDAWSGWMKYMLDQGIFNADGTWTMPKESVDRWQRQMITSYSNLPEREKESDREEADKILAIMETS